MRGSPFLRSLFFSFHCDLGRLFRAQNEELTILYSENNEAQRERVHVNRQYLRQKR